MPIRKRERERAFWDSFHPRETRYESQNIAVTCKGRGKVLSLSVDSWLDALPQPRSKPNLRRISGLRPLHISGGVFSQYKAYSLVDVDVDVRAPIEIYVLQLLYSMYSTVYVCNSVCISVCTLSVPCFSPEQLVFLLKEASETRKVSSGRILFTRLVPAASIATRIAVRMRAL